VWAGDYANVEKDQHKNLYSIAENKEYNCQDFFNNKPLYLMEKEKYIYLVNHSKKQYVNKHNISNGELHPLPFLVAEGNGRGGGDYYGKNIDLVGCWARDSISIEKNIPLEYTEIYNQTLFDN
jgi:hypothetical protein